MIATQKFRRRADIAVKEEQSNPRRVDWDIGDFDLLYDLTFAAEIREKCFELRRARRAIFAEAKVVADYETFERGKFAYEARDKGVRRHFAQLVKRHEKDRRGAKPFARNAGRKAYTIVLNREQSAFVAKPRDESLMT
jgi:hypothetical protein